MKYIILIVLVQFLSIHAYSQEVNITNFAELEKEFRKHSDSSVVVNFWATWCRPCVEEMKYFIQAGNDRKYSNSIFIYVSLDMSKEKDKVEQFVKKAGLKGKFYILKDDPNIYITKIDKTWEGEIPLTLIVKPDKSYETHRAAFSSYQDLEEFIKKNIK
jgi:thiol-disulfide isomerase/thioredoxin